MVAAKIAVVLKEIGYRTSNKTVRKLKCDIGLVSIRLEAKSMSNVINLRVNSITLSNFTCFSLVSYLAFGSEIPMGHSYGQINSYSMESPEVSIKFVKQLSISSCEQPDSM